MRRYFLFAALLISLLSTKAGNITFMTYNLLGNDGLNFQALRVSKHAQIITTSGADVIAVQEVAGNSNFNSLKDKTGLAGSWFDISNTGYGIGVLWKASLGTPKITNVKVDPVSGSTDSESRAFIVAEFPDFCFFATHFSLNAVDRDSMVVKIIQYAKAAGKTVFVGGDFNAQPTYRALVALQDNNFKVLNTLTDYTYPAKVPASLIDMILGYRNNDTDKVYNVIQREIPAPPSGITFTDASDHLPYCVTVDLAIANPNQLVVTSNGTDAAVQGTLAWCISQAQDGDVIGFDFNGSQISSSAIFSIPTGKSITINGLNKYNNEKVIMKGDITAFSVSGSLTLINLIIRDKTNSAVISAGTLMIDSCAFINNKPSADNGGAIRISGGTSMIKNSLFDGNSAGGTYGGGALCVYNSGASVILQSTSFINNNAIQGGALSVLNGADLTVTNCTFSQNKALGSSVNMRGGAIYCACPDNNTTLEAINCTIINSTITGNSAVSNGGGICAYGRTDQKKININLVNSILAYNVQATAYNDLYNWNNDVRVFIMVKNCIFGATNYSTYIDGSSKVPDNIENATIFNNLNTFQTTFKAPALSVESGMTVAELASGSIASGSGICLLNGFSIPLTDQLGNNRLSPPAIGAVEYYTLTTNGGLSNNINDKIKLIVSGREVRFVNSPSPANLRVYNSNGMLLFQRKINDDRYFSFKNISGHVFILQLDDKTCKIVLL